MVATLIVPWPETVSDSRAGASELVLRISGPNQQWRIVRLTSRKCLIGSAPYCTLRLKAKGISPVHCLILRGRQAAVVRCWAAGTLLNHQSFDDALLSPGDCLTIGSLELKVLDLGLPGPEWQETSAKLQEQEQCQKLEQEREQWLEQQRAWQTEQTALRNEIERLKKQLAAQTALLEGHSHSQVAENPQEVQEEGAQEEDSQWEQTTSPISLSPENPTSESVEVMFQTPSAEAPVNLQEVLRRLGANVALPEDDDNRQPSLPTPPKHPWQAEQEIARRDSSFRPADTKAAAEADPKMSAAQSAQAEDAVLDEYIKRLMERLSSTPGEKNGRQTSTLEPTTKNSPPAHLQESNRRSGETTIASDRPNSVASEEVEPAPARPRAVAPERHIDFSALRELANLSAYNAITRYSRRLLVSSMFSKLFVTGVALFAGAVLLWQWKSSSGWELTFYAGLIALLIAVYWGVQYALLTGKLIISKSGHIDWNISSHPRPRKVSAEPKPQSDPSGHIEPTGKK